MPQAVSARPDRSTATVVFWIRSHIFPRVSHRSVHQCSTSDKTTKKYSQMDFQKDKRGTSTNDSPLTPSLTPIPTTTSLTVILKTRNLNCCTVIRARKLPRLKLQRVYHSYHKARMGLGIARQLRSLLNRLNFPANYTNRPHREFVRPGKVALIRDIAAVTYAKPAICQFSCLVDLPQLRGYALFFVHWRGSIRPA